MPKSESTLPVRHLADQSTAELIAALQDIADKFAHLDDDHDVWVSIGRIRHALDTLLTRDLDEHE